MNVTVRVNNSANADTITIYNAANTAQLPQRFSTLQLRANHTAGHDALRRHRGDERQPGRGHARRARRRVDAWLTSTTAMRGRRRRRALDLAGNAASTTAVNETGLGPGLLMRLSYLFNFLAAVAVVGVLIFGTADSRAAFKLMGASGAVSLSNSREGAAILIGCRATAGRAVERIGDDRQPGLLRDQARARRHVRGRDRRRRRRADLGHAADLDQRRLERRLRGPRGGPRPAHARRARRGRPADLCRDGHAPFGRERQRAPGRAALAPVHVARRVHRDGHRADAGPAPSARRSHRPSRRARRRPPTATRARRSRPRS